MELSNDNKRLDYGVSDPDRHYAREQVTELCDHLRAHGIDRNTVAAAMLDEMFRMLNGNPFRTGADEGAIRADQQFLWPIKHRIVSMSLQWDKGWLRLQAEKRARFHFNRAAPKPQPGPGRRLQAPPPDYDAGQHAADLVALKLRLGHVYSEREVQTRYRKRLLRMMGDNRHQGGIDMVKYLAASRKRVLGWMRRTRHLVTDRETA